MATTDFKPVEHPTVCRKCASLHVEYREWTSSDEAHEDLQFRCKTCGHHWWVEGSDS